MREYVPCKECVYDSKACPNPNRRLMPNGFNYNILGCSERGLLKEKALRRLQRVLDYHMMWKRMTRK